LGKDIKIAVLSLYSHALYSEHGLSMGGAERRAYYWLKLLQESGFSVSAILAHPKRKEKKVESRLTGPWPLFEHPKYRMDGHIVRAAVPIGGISGKLRDKFLSLFSLPIPDSKKTNKELGTGIYGHINADVYVAFGLTNPAHELARFCKERGKKFAVSVAGDVDFDFLEKPIGKDAYDSDRERKPETLWWADIIVAQTRKQAEKLKEAGIPSSKVKVILNPISILPLPEKRTKTFILWIGKSDSNKNPEAVMELAKKSPQLAFCLILGGRLSPTLATEIRKQSNIQIVEAVKPQDMRPYYLNASCLLSTAHAEGFPNAFLEAWEAGVPVASLHVNPGDLLTDSGLGFWAAGRLDGLNAVLQEWANAPEKAIAIGEKGREYVQANHDCNPIKIQLEKVFQH